MLEEEKRDLYVTVVGRPMERSAPVRVGTFLCSSQWPPSEKPTSRDIPATVCEVLVSFLKCTTQVHRNRSDRFENLNRSSSNF